MQPSVHELRSIHPRRYADTSFWSIVIPTAVLAAVLVCFGLVLMLGIGVQSSPLVAIGSGLVGVAVLCCFILLLIGIIWSCSWLTATIYNFLTNKIGPLQVTLAKEGDALSLLNIDAGRYFRYQLVRVALSTVIMLLMVVPIALLSKDPALVFQLGPLFDGMSFLPAYGLYFLGTAIIGVLCGQLLVAVYNRVQKPLRATVVAEGSSTAFKIFGYWPVTAWFFVIMVVQVLVLIGLSVSGLAPQPSADEPSVYWNAIILLFVPLFTLIGLALYGFAVSRTGGVLVELVPAGRSAGSEALASGTARLSAPAVPAVTRARAVPAKRAAPARSSRSAPAPKRAAAKATKSRR